MGCALLRAAAMRDCAARVTGPLVPLFLAQPTIPNSDLWMASLIRDWTPNWGPLLPMTATSSTKTTRENDQELWKGMSTKADDQPSWSCARAIPESLEAKRVGSNSLL